MKAIITLELEVDEDIGKKYPNFYYNYDSPKDFIFKEIASYNEKLKLEDDFGYRTKVLDYKLIGE